MKHHNPDQSGFVTLLELDAILKQAKAESIQLAQAQSKKMNRKERVAFVNAFKSVMGVYDERIGKALSQVSELRKGIIPNETIKRKTTDL